MKQAIKAMKTNKESKTIIATARKDAKAMVSAAMKEAASGGAKQNEASEPVPRAKRPHTW